ncbi:hypothetical protein DSO57_1038452 [Entomophthora muscae]|uniref:Uncharacterized protein n=1 Tax=Entomophthora muscae TaxID=34485 RepID=A0ACC2SBN8_9FUNG|nr:hypothetical protein DSO57_1038452 [Entomophthora muscae]
MVPEPGFTLKSKNPGAGESPLPASPRLVARSRNDNLDAPESQSTEPESKPEKTPLQTARSEGREPNSLLLIKKVGANPPGSNSLTNTQGSASKPPVQDAGNFPKVSIPDTSSLLGEIHKFSNKSYSKLPQSPVSGTESEEVPNSQVAKQKDSKASHPKAVRGNPPVPSATLPSKTPNAKPPELRSPTRK